MSDVWKRRACVFHSDPRVTTRPDHSLTITVDEPIDSVVACLSLNKTFKILKGSHGSGQAGDERTFDGTQMRKYHTSTG